MTAGLIDRLRGGLIVSCQAAAGHPLRASSVLARLARAAELGGAAGLRVNGTSDVRAVRAVTALPLIGIRKVRRAGLSRDLITPGLRHAAALVAAGADIIGVEATSEVAETAGDPAALIARVRAEFGVPVMADVATAEEGLRAWDAGADLVATTLSGYTYGGIPGDAGPDLPLVGALHAKGIRTVGEGRYGTPAQVTAAFADGAFAVVVGTAITDPVTITRRFAQAAPGYGTAATADPG